MGIVDIFVVQKPSGIYYCMICNCDMPSHRSTVEHREGHRHETSLKQYGRHMILERNNHRYFCTCCGCRVYGWINVYPHLRGKRHTVLVNKSDESLATCAGLPCDFVFRRSDNTYKCSLCNCEMSGPQPAEEHLAGARHAISLNTYGRDIVLFKNNHHYCCRLCKCQFLGYYHIWGHINGRRHKGLMSLARNEE